MHCIRAYFVRLRLLECSYGRNGTPHRQQHSSRANQPASNTHPTQPVLKPFTFTHLYAENSEMHAKAIKPENIYDVRWRAMAVGAVYLQSKWLSCQINPFDLMELPLHIGFGNALGRFSHFLFYCIEQSQ